MVRLRRLCPRSGAQSRANVAVWGLRAAFRVIAPAQALADKALGAICVAVAAAVFVYYTAWVAVVVRAAATRARPWVSTSTHGAATQPFLPADHPVQAFFLSQTYALLFPSALLVAAFTFVALFILKVVLSKRAAKKQQ